MSHIFNPNNVDLTTLPVIYGFEDGGNAWGVLGRVVASDGTMFTGHVSSDDAWLQHDLGMLDSAYGTSKQREYAESFPDGYRTEFVRYKNVPHHPALWPLIEAMNRAQ
jgi:hypothetical protein